MLSNAHRFRDRNPDIVPAGKCFTLGDSAKQCLENPKRPRTPEKIHKFRCTTQSAPGRTRIFYGRYGDPDVASLLTHGVDTKPSLQGGTLINPRPRSWFAHRLQEKKEENVYASLQRAPLGQSHDQRPGLPRNVSPYDNRYGLPTLKDYSAGELVNPAKDQKQVDEEAVQGQELYKISHSAFPVGESYNRKYDWTRIPQNSTFGIETPHDNRGLNTKKTLKWLTETQSDKAAHITTTRVDDFRERDLPQVGKVHDPIKDTLLVTDDHTYGIMVQPDEYGAGDLIHMRNSNNYLRGKDRLRGVLASIRQHLKKANYHNFGSLKAAFAFYDKDKSGTIDMQELKDVCLQFNLPVQRLLLEQLLEVCDRNGDQQIDYVEFANFLNWKDKMTSGLVTGESADNDYDKVILDKAHALDEDHLGKQVDSAQVDYTTSASEIGDTSRPNIDYRSYGVPTIRSDLPAPRIRRIGDSKNYGDESDAYGLINPSIYSNNGVYEQDFFEGRQPEELKMIFERSGVEMTNEVFQTLWKKARETSSNGEVSVEGFRCLLDDAVSSNYEQAVAADSKDQDLASVIKNMTTTKPDLYKKFDKMTVNDKQVLAS